MGVIISSVLALDVGGKRVGLALASLVARLPSPFMTLTYDDNFFAALTKIIRSENVSQLVVGLPRGLEGQATSQTAEVKAFVEELRRQVSVPIDLQDEAVTSKQAEAELVARGKNYAKTDIDSLAANYILQDWLAENKVK